MNVNPWKLLAAAAVASLTAACTSAPAATQAVGTPSASARPTASPTPPPVVPPRITISRVRTKDGSQVTVAVFGGTLRYVLHNGSFDPGKAAAKLVSAGPVVAGSARRHLLAAFNGGFMLKARAGGYEQEGHIIRALRRGLASLVIDRSGHATVGMWGEGVPVPGDAVYSVRQNLWPLLAHGRPTAESARWWRWGGTIGHLEYVARSAVGENAAGELLFAASMHTTPADLAKALASKGAVIAMELDINPEWVQFDTARHPGGKLTAQIPGQHRPASQYLDGWTRDFFTVQSP